MTISDRRLQARHTDDSGLTFSKSGKTTAGRTVFLIDDDPAMLFLWSKHLRAAGLRVVVAETAEPVMARLAAGERGCVVVEMSIPGQDGLAFQNALHIRGITLPILFTSGRADVQTAVAAMKAGAFDFLCKPINPDALVETVSRALRKDEETSRDQENRAQARARWAELSTREREVCRLFARGLLNKQIAAMLGTAPTTVQTQRARALQKLRVGSAPELLRLLEDGGAME